MKLPVAVLSALFSPMLLSAVDAGAPQDAEKSEQAVVVSSEPSNVDWNGGSLAVLATDTQETLLTLSFKMPSGRRFTSMVLHARNWTLDITRQVSGIERPYPTRAKVNIYKFDAKRNIEKMWLSIPYGLDDCHEVRFEIEKGRLTKTFDTSLVAPEACGP